MLIRSNSFQNFLKFRITNIINVPTCQFWWNLLTQQSEQKTYFLSFCYTKSLQPYMIRRLNIYQCRVETSQLPASFPRISLPIISHTPISRLSPTTRFFLFWEVNSAFATTYCAPQAFLLRLFLVLKFYSLKNPITT